MTTVVALASLYPSATSAGGMAIEPVIDEAADATPTAAPEKAAADATSAGGQPSRAEAARQAEPEPDAPSNVLYEDTPATRNFVRWEEKPLTSTDDPAFRLDVPAELRRDDAEAQAEHRRIREALIDAGAGPTIAAELWSDAVRAERTGRCLSINPTQTLVELRAAWGRNFDRNLSMAQTAIQKAAAKSPELIPFLNRTGLGNDPAFIRKVARAAARGQR